MAERVVKVRLSAQVADYQKGMLEAAQATRTVGTEGEKLAQKREAFNQLGTAALGVGTAMTAMSVLSAKAAMDWESAWAGVTKTVDGTPEQLQAVEDGLRGLTSVLPASHEEIAAVAEAAGQLGIETDNVVEFTRTMIDLGETTNLSANDAATALARFVNIMGTSQDEVDNLGSALVGLGNNYATTEAEILEMSMRLAGAGRQIGLSEGEVLGLATALSSVGIEAEAGGSAMSKVMIDIAASVEEGGDRLALFAKTAGMSAENFAEQWRTSPSLALASFVKGLANAENQGSSTLAVLAELEISEIRMRDALLRSSSAADLFAGAMEMGNEEYEKNNALSEEAAKRYATVESQVAIAANAVRDAAIDFGQVFLPAISAVAGGVKELAEFFSGLPEPVQGTIAVLTAVVGVTGLVGGAALLAIPKIAEFRIAMQVLGINAGAARGSLASMASVMGGPFLLALTGAIAVAGILIATNEAMSAAAASFRDTLEDQTGAITENTAKLVARKLQEADAFEQAKKAGISQKELTEAILEGGDAYDQVLAKLRDAHDATGGFDAGLGNAINTVRQMGVQMDDAKDGFENIEAATEGATEAAVENEIALDAVGDSAENAQEEIDALADAIRGFASRTLDSRDANRKFEQALDDLTESIEENGTSLAIGTQEGRNNESALDAVAQAALRSAAATLANTNSQDEAKASLQRGREELIRMLEQFGITGAEAEAYADKLGLIPENIQTVAQVETAAAESKIAELTRRRVMYIDSIVTNGGARPLQGGVTSANGNLIDYGRAFANGGGVETGIYAGQPQSIHKFAEPETIWEAYISGKPDQRDRNIGIWQETGRRLGVDSAPAQVSIEGARLTGTLDLGNGLTGFVDARIRDAKRSDDVAWSGGGTSL